MSAQLSRQAERQERLETQTAELIEQLAGELSQGHTDVFKQTLAFWAKLYRYSARNVLLIQMQKPDASAVASYNRWRELGRQVVKGATAAFIYAPVTERQKDEATGETVEKVVNFRLVPVFSDRDLADIDTNPLPQLWGTLPDDSEDLYQRIKQVIVGTGIEVIERPMRGGVMGASFGGRIAISSKADSRNRIATLAHEWGHEIAHQGAENQQDRTKAQEELEVEASAFVVCQRLGLGHPFAVDYLLQHGITPDQLRASLGEIGRITRRIFRVLEQAGVLDQNKVAA